MSSLVKLLTVFLCTIVVSQAQTANEGDARLVNGETPADGTLQVYLNGGWNYVCQLNLMPELTTLQTAVTACKQLGYTNFKNYTNPVVNASANFNVLMGLSCPPVWDSEKEGGMLLQRCQVGTVENYDPDTCFSLLGIRCDNKLAPYNGQIRTVKDDKHTSLLEINFSDEWRPMCIKKNQMSDFIANSACRQMGYTSSKQYHKTIDNPNSKSWTVSLMSSTICNSSGSLDPHPSYACLTNPCIEKSYVVDNCDQDFSQYELICQFDKNEESLYSAGNPLACVYKTEQLNIALFCVIGTLLVVSKITLILGIMVILLSCHLHRQQRRSKTVRLNDKAAAVNYGTTEKQ